MFVLSVTPGKMRFVEAVFKAYREQWGDSSDEEGEEPKRKPVAEGA